MREVSWMTIASVQAKIMMYGLEHQQPARDSLAMYFEGKIRKTY